MVYTWSSQFNNSPSGSDFGSVLASNLRASKVAFYERLEAQHAIIEGVTPLVTHVPGSCSVVGFGSTEEELARTTPQTLFYDYETHKFYAYNLVGEPLRIGSFQHSEYTNRDADDHTQYAKDLSEVTGALTVDSITNLGTSGTEPYLLDETLHSASDHYPLSESSYKAPYRKLNTETIAVSATIIEALVETSLGTAQPIVAYANVSGILLGAMFTSSATPGVYYPAQTGTGGVYIIGLQDESNLLFPRSISVNEASAMFHVTRLIEGV